MCSTLKLNLGILLSLRSFIYRITKSEENFVSKHDETFFFSSKKKRIKYIFIFCFVYLSTYGTDQTQPNMKTKPKLHLGLLSGLALGLFALGFLLENVFYLIILLLVISIHCIFKIHTYCLHHVSTSDCGIHSGFTCRLLGIYSGFTLVNPKKASVNPEVTHGLV